MKVRKPVAERPVKEQAAMLSWLGKEALPLLSEMRDAINDGVGNEVVNVQRYGARADNGATDNTAAFTKAIVAANANNVPIYVPDSSNGGQYWFTTSTPLPLITVPYQGGHNSPHLKWSAGIDGDCMAFKGVSHINNLSVSNMRTDPLTARSACIRLTNVAYGNCDRLTAFCGAVNNSGIMLEIDNDGSAADVYLNDHIGEWYNVFRNLQVTYLTVGANVGYGVDFYVNPRSAGKEVSYNWILGLNVEGVERGVSLANANTNTIEGGQFLGNKYQVYGDAAQGNRFFATKHNQWDVAGGAFYMAASRGCVGNWYGGQVFFQNGGGPFAWRPPGASWEEALGAGATWCNGPDGIIENGIVARGGLFVGNLDNGLVPTVHTASMWDCSIGGTTYWSFGPRTDNSGIATLYGLPNATAPSATNYVVQSNGSGIAVNAPDPASLVTVSVGGNVVAQFQTPANNDDTGAVLVRKQGGVVTAQQVTQGAADSGGVGYKCLRVPN